MRNSYPTATILASGTTSDTISTNIIGTEGTQLAGLEFPAAMTGTTMTFTGSRASDGTFVALRDVGGAAAYSVTVTANVFVPVDPRVFATFPFIKLVSGSTEASQRSIVVHLRPVS